MRLCPNVLRVLAGTLATASLGACGGAPAAQQTTPTVAPVVASNANGTQPIATALIEGSTDGTTGYTNASYNTVPPPDYYPPPCGRG